MLTKVKTKSEILAMKNSGQMLASILDDLKKITKINMSTKDLAIYAAKELKKLGGEPAFLGYQGFPDVLCVSINNEVVHGIPRADKFIHDGDLVSLDFGVRYKGMITDSAISFIVGDGSYADEQLVINTEKAMNAGIDVLKDGAKVGDIGNAVEAVLNKDDYGIVRDLVGHGVGHDLHEEPNIPNYGSKNTGMTIRKGMTIAIEPMATIGSFQVFVANDGWTILTRDGSRAAHFEHTILVTDNGAEILTVKP